MENREKKKQGNFLSWKINSNGLKNREENILKGKWKAKDKIFAEKRWNFDVEVKRFFEEKGRIALLETSWSHATL